MTLWEIMLIIVCLTVCNMLFVTFAVNSIIDAIDKYKDRRAAKDMQLFAKVMEQIPELMTKTVNLVIKKTEEQEEKERQKMEELLKKEE